MELPGATIAPLATFRPAIMPVPINVPPELTNTVDANDPFTLSAPALMLVGPVYVFAPVSTCKPAPILVTPPEPAITPEKLVFVLSLPVVSAAEPRVTLPASASEPIVWLKLARLSAAPLATVYALLAENAFAAPA